MTPGREGLGRDIYANTFAAVPAERSGTAPQPPIWTYETWAYPSASACFSHTTDGVIYRIKEVSGMNTYTLEPLCGGADEGADNVHGQTVNSYSADRLVKLDMPEYEGAPEAGSQGIEIYMNDRSEWARGTVEKVAVDGRLLIRFEHSGLTKWIDVTRTRYRWLVGERALASEEAPAVPEGAEGSP